VRATARTAAWHVLGLVIDLDADVAEASIDV